MKNKKQKIGIIGRNFGNKVANELVNTHEIRWHVGAVDNLSKLESVDIVYIASPIEYHFEHAKLFLQKKTAVVVEKPPTLSVRALEHLIGLARDNSTFIYFSDVFNFRSDIIEKISGSECIHWSKSSSNNDWVASRFAYHYLYLFADYLTEYETLQVSKCTKDELKFKLMIDSREVRFEFFQNAKTNIHQINNFVVPQGITGPIKAMLDLSNLTEVSINENNRKAKLVIKFLERLREDMPKVSVVGGGIFGSQAAIMLAKSGINVTLFEKNLELMSQASSINQYRVHLGYHYPRSRETVSECKGSLSQFIRTFSPAVITENEAYYAISSSDSKISADGYKKFLEAMELPYQEVSKIKNCDLTVKVEENLYSPYILKKLVVDRLNCLGVNLKLGKAVNPDEMEQNDDLTVFATYSNSGHFDGLDYQHEICEKPVVRLPKKYGGKGYVIMDGPFMCIDPFERSGLHVMGNVVHAIHHSNIGKLPVIPEKYQSLINNGIVRSEDLIGITKFSDFKKTYEQFFDFADEIEHVGSMFTVRSVLPNREHDDARPTAVRWIDAQTLLVFSGKVVTCVRAADRIVELTWNGLRSK